MQKEILEYLDTQRTGVLAIEMLDGSPHASTVHFAYTKDPVIFLFETEKAYKKSEALLNRETSRASLVIGTSEADKKTLQLDGTVQLLTSKEENLKDAYLSKFPEKAEKSKSGKFIFFKFTPSWWRYTAWKPEGKVIYSS